MKYYGSTTSRRAHQRKCRRWERRKERNIIARAVKALSGRPRYPEFIDVYICPRCTSHQQALGPRNMLVCTSCKYQCLNIEVEKRRFTFEAYQRLFGWSG
jgi:hypothetical protein